MMELELSSLTLPVRLRPNKPMSDEELLRFSGENRSLRMEREASGDLLIMTPTGNRTGKINSRLSRLLDEWAEEDGRGYAFDSSTGFRLGNGAVRSPDASWVVKERWDGLAEAEQDGYAPICPEFVIELSSPSDRAVDVRKKIVEEWLGNGTELAWLIDPERKVVEVYRAGEETEVHETPTSVRGSGCVAGFELVMGRVWG